MTDSGHPPGSGPLVCPFVALAEDRDRRADLPDEGNRCYAERAPRQRDMVYQADYCYSPDFAQCSVFLGWAARSAAEPAFVSQAAQKAWGSGISAPQPGDGGEPVPPGDAERLPPPTPEEGLFGAPEPGSSEGASSGREQLDWVPAGAWAEVPWDERAEMEADELESLVDGDLEDEADDEDDDAPSDEATQPPKVPAAVPTRRRRRVQPVISSRGSGEWFYADPPGHEPLVKRRYGITPPILLAVLGLLVAALVVFMIPTLFFGGDEGQTAALPSPSSAAGTIPRVTPAAVVATAAPSAEPSITPKPNPRFYRVKSGDSLTGIATRFGVKPQHLQCINGIKNRNIVVLGARYEIPPEGFTCPPNWRNATPEP